MKDTIIVIGASLKRSRVSNEVVRILSKHNYNVTAVGRGIGQINNVVLQASPPDHLEIDVISLYINSTIQEKYYSWILDQKPKLIIFNPGTENPDFEDLLEQNKIPFRRLCNLVLLRTHQFDDLVKEVKAL